MKHTNAPFTLAFRRRTAWLLACLSAFVLVGCRGDGGTNDSAPALEVPSITAQPLGVTVVAPAPATFTVQATGGDPLAYQWQRNGTPIAGATASS